MSLLHRLLILVIVSLLPIAALDAINSWSLRADKAQQVVEDAQNLLVQLTGEQRRVIEGVRNTLATLRRTKSVREADDEACRSLMRGLRAEYPAHLDVFAVDHTGRVRCSTNPGAVSLDLSDRQHVREALKGTEFHVGRQIVSRASGRRALPFSMPARDDSGAIIGAVTATLDLGWFEDYLASKPLPLNAVLHLADRDGTLLVRLPHIPGKVGSRIPDGLMALMHADAPGVREMTGVDGMPRVMAYSPLGADGLFTWVGIDRAATLAPIDRALARSMLVLALTLFAAAATAFWMGQRYLHRPIQQLTAAARRWREGDLSARAAVGAGDLATLAADFNAMAAALEAREDLRRRAEEALAESERRYHFMADSVPQIVWTADPDGSLDFIGARMAEYAGIGDVQKFLSTGWTDILHPDDLPGTMAAWDKARRTGSALEVEYRLRRHDGTYRWHLARALPMRDTSGRVAKWFGSTVDVHDRKLQADALAATRDEAEQANLSKSKFLAAASHDLRQPMQSVILLASALENHVHDEGAQETLTHLQLGLDMLKGLLDSLLDVSRLDAGLVEANIGDVSIRQLVEQIGASYRPVAATRDLRFSVKNCQSGTVRSDPVLLGRLVRNLVENALRYTENGFVELACVPLDGKIRLEVRDTGVGIPPEHLGRIWEEFHQVGNQERDRQQGLGLAIVRRLADLLGHKVEVRSEPGRGSVFSVEMTPGLQRMEEVPVQAARPAQAAVEGRGRFAVLVDDDAIVLMGLQAILAEWEFEVLAAGSTDQALEQLRDAGRRPDIVIADYRLRDGRVGTEAIVKIREMFGASVPGIILTGEMGSAFQHEAAAHGLLVIHKPITPRQLGKVLEQKLEPVPV